MSDQVFDDIKRLIQEQGEESRRQNDQTRRHFDTVAEGLRKDIQQVAEGVLTLTGRADRTDQRFDGVEQRLDRIEVRLDGIDTRLDGIDTRLDGIDTRLDGIDTRLDGHDGRFASLETRFDGMEHAMREGFDDVRSAIRISYSQLDSRLTSVEELRTRVERLESIVLGKGE